MIATLVHKKLSQLDVPNKHKAKTQIKILCILSNGISKIYTYKLKRSFTSTTKLNETEVLNCCLQICFKCI